MPVSERASPFSSHENSCRFGWRSLRNLSKMHAAYGDFQHRYPTFPYGRFLKWWVSPTNAWGFPTKNAWFWGVLGVPPFKETPISWRILLPSYESPSIWVTSINNVLYNNININVLSCESKGTPPMHPTPSPQEIRPYSGTINHHDLSIIRALFSAGAGIGQVLGCPL